MTIQDTPRKTLETGFLSSYERHWTKYSTTVRGTPEQDMITVQKPAIPPWRLLPLLRDLRMFPVVRSQHSQQTQQTQQARSAARTNPRAIRQEREHAPSLRPDGQDQQPEPFLPSWRVARARSLVTQQSGSSSFARVVDFRDSGDDVHRQQRQQSTVPAEEKGRGVV